MHAVGAEPPYREHGAHRPPSPGKVIDTEAEPWETQYAMWCHLGPLIGGVVGAASQGIAFWVPLVIAIVLWRIKADESPFIDDHGRESVNFQISLFLLGLIAVLVGMATCGLGLIVTIPAVLILGLIGMIMGSVAGSRAEYFRYPACFRFLKGPRD